MFVWYYSYSIEVWILKCSWLCQWYPDWNEESQWTQEGLYVDMWWNQEGIQDPQKSGNDRMSMLEKSDKFSWWINYQTSLSHTKEKHISVVFLSIFFFTSLICLVMLFRLTLLSNDDIVYYNQCCPTFFCVPQIKFLLQHKVCEFSYFVTDTTTKSNLLQNNWIIQWYMGIRYCNHLIIVCSPTSY